MIRPMRESDLPRLRELQGEFAWEFGRDFAGALVVVDAQDVPVAIAGAWRRAEVHMVMDSRWETPGMRWEALRQLHAAMEAQLSAEGVGEAITWMDGMKALCRRLKGLGWGKAARPMWARRI